MVGEWRAINLLHQQHCSTTTVTTQVRDTTATRNWLPVRGAEQMQWQCPREGWWK
ncbi:hypothetical protein A2U01_0081325, partial [Trifolium medium]|nr:hypothetical protein [Trifolium medium]